MKASFVCATLNIADSTLRKYAQEYASYLSSSAAGGRGRHREYDEHDVRIIKLINDMKVAKQTAGDIEVTLSSLQTNNWERLPALDDATNALIPAPGMMIQSQTRQAVLENEVKMLREQIQDLKAERAERDELVKQLAQKEMLLKLYEEGTLKFPREMQ